ncbi:MAG: zinc-binding alcohol dehydrogenase [Ornithinimicrobium sp.]
MTEPAPADTKDPPPATAYWVTGPNTGSLRSHALPLPGAGEVAVRAQHSAISRGTERLVQAGMVPPEVAPAMRAPFQIGDFGGDVKYGYLSVGVITEFGRGSAESLGDSKRRRIAAPRPDQIGQRVFCHYPHQDRYVVPAQRLSVVPDDVPSDRATLAGTVETAINIVWDARPRWADRVAVIGCGLVGACVAILLHRMRLHDLVMVDPDPATQTVAALVGARWRTPDQCADEGLEVDLAIHCSGTQAGLHLGLSMLDVEGELIEASWFGERCPTVPLGADFHAKRLSIRASQVSEVAFSSRSRRSRQDRVALALHELRDPLYDTLITGHIRFADLPTAMARLGEPCAGRWCQVVDYGDVPDHDREE